MTPLIESRAWKNLEEHCYNIKNLHLRDVFTYDEDRYERYHIQFGDLLFDYSKNRINFDTISHLLELARYTHLKKRIEELYAGNKVNFTENRAAMHIALRSELEDSYMIDGVNVSEISLNNRNKFLEFADEVHHGKHLGYSGQKFTNIVNIGIGGSDLGPRMVSHALRYYSKPGMKVHYVSNVDSTDIYEVLRTCEPENTLFLIASKTFTTMETMINANLAKKWFEGVVKDSGAVAKHFVAMSTNVTACKEFGIDESKIFGFDEWVGGRFSLWSSVGLSVALFVGSEHFRQLLAGARSADIHFKNEPFTHNIPVILAFLQIWYNCFFGFKSRAVIPYDENLHWLPAYLQQLEMESNGKSVNKEGKRTGYSSCPIVWGSTGTNSQHSYFQLIHQGSEVVPVEFILSALSFNDIDKSHSALVANCFAQAEALMLGKTKQQVTEELSKKGFSQNEIEKALPYRIFDGNRPSTTWIIKKLTPYNLGTLIAIYEHKVFAEAAMLGINPFDQWGVELGKQLAGQILPQLESDELITNHDSSTNALINHIKSIKGQI